MIFALVTSLRAVSIAASLRHRVMFPTTHSGDQMMNNLTLFQQMSIVAGVIVLLIVSLTAAAVWLAHRQNNRD